MLPKLKMELLNNYMFLGWLFVFAGLMGTLYVISGPGGQEFILGFAATSFLCGLLLIYVGYTKKTFFKKKK